MQNKERPKRFFNSKLEKTKVADQVQISMKQETILPLIFDLSQAEKLLQESRFLYLGWQRKGLETYTCNQTGDALLPACDFDSFILNSVFSNAIESN